MTGELPQHPPVPLTQDQWAVYFAADDIEFCPSEQDARDELDRARQWAASDDPQLAEAYAGARLVKRTVTTTVTAWQDVPDR